MALTLEEKMEKVIEQYDPDLVVEMLGISTKQLLEAFTEEFLERYSCFEDKYTETEENEYDS